MDFKGTIIHILEPRSFNSKKDGKTFVIQEFVIENNETQFPRKLVFAVFGQDKLNEMNIQLGETLTVKFDIDAREYNGKWYNDIRAWRVERLPQQAVVQPQQAVVQPQQPVSTLTQQIPAPASSAYTQTNDNLPF